MPMQRFREHAGLRSWIPRSATGKDAEITKIQMSRGLKNNSIRDCPDFNLLDIDRVRNPGRGKHLRNAGIKSISEAERKSRRNKEVKRLDQIRKSLEVADTQLLEGPSTKQPAAEADPELDASRSEVEQLPLPSQQTHLTLKNPMLEPVFPYSAEPYGTGFHEGGDFNQDWRYPTLMMMTEEVSHKRKRGASEQPAVTVDVNDEPPYPTKRARLETRDFQSPGFVDYRQTQTPPLTCLVVDPQVLSYNDRALDPSYGNDLASGSVGVPTFESSREGTFTKSDLVQPSGEQAGLPYPPFDQGLSSYQPFDAPTALASSSHADPIQPAADSRLLDPEAMGFDLGFDFDFESGMMATLDKGRQECQQSTVQSPYRDPSFTTMPNFY